MRIIAGLEQIDEVIVILRSGGVIIYPTETVYGIGCLADQHNAIDRITALKGSSESAAYLILIRDSEQMHRYCSAIPDTGTKLIEQFWPGPLTLVMPAEGGLHSRLVGTTGGVAVRQSPHPWPRALLDKLPAGIVSTSANLSGQRAPGKIDDLDSEVAEKVDLIIDDGELSGGVSTVLDLCGDSPQVIREGAISADEIELVIKGGIPF